mgnify:CR=1 FL=1
MSTRSFPVYIHIAYSNMEDKRALKMFWYVIRVYIYTTNSNQIKRL